MKLLPRSLAFTVALAGFPALVAAQDTEAAYDKIPFAGLAPARAVREMTVPPGFAVKLFAAEPDVHQPIAMALDARGRLWVAEGHTYPIPAPEGQGRDRIVVFEDGDGDGKFDRRTVFIEGLNLVSGMELGFGGVYVGAAPNLLFIPVIDGEAPRPGGKSEVLLDGWGNQDTHETLNTFTWGPDGWLYGCHGVFTHSKVGKPGTAENSRVPINGGIWRYHPTRKVFEVFAEGTSNPWGIDFNDHGEAFATACVIPHLFHIIPGARYNRQAGSHFNSFIFDDIKTCADHLHYATATPHAGNRRSAASGGGHAHCGAMIYLGGSWPSEYRGQIFMNNIHGARINMDRLDRRGSGYVGRHGPDFLLANDEWSQIINLRYGPDGSAYMIDWYDKQACHTKKPEDHDRSNGRIFKVAHANDKPVPGLDLGKLSMPELVALQNSPNDWYVRTSRRLLQERHASDAAVHRLLLDILEARGIGAAPPSINKEDWITTRQLRALWALHCTNGLEDETLIALLGHDNEWLRAWAVRLLCEDGDPPPSALNMFVQMAAGGDSATVRLHLAAAAQRVPLAQRWDLVTALASRQEDADDPNLPLVVWYAVEPLPVLDPARALDLAAAARLPRLLNFTSRRIAAIGTPVSLSALVKALSRTVDEDRQFAILQGMNEAFRAQKQVAVPEGWNELAPKLAANARLQAEVLTAAVKFGSTDALAALRKQVADAQADPAARGTALDALIAAKDPSLAPTLQQLLAHPSLRGAALRGLANYNDPRTPQSILGAYESLNPAEKRDALNTLISRADYARALVAAVEAKTVPPRDLTAELVRQLRQLKQAELNIALDRVWGTVRETSADKQKEIAKYKALYLAGGSTPGDATRGRLVYSRACQQCHTFFDEGGKIGPDLTGSNRANLDYILENIVTPNAVIPNDYRAAVIETKDGRTLIGPVKQEDVQAVTLMTLSEPVTVPRNEIQSLELSELSMMPDGLLEAFNEQEVRDLIYYLASPSQVPMAPEAAGSP